jgi:hypothetical protein
MLAVAPTGRHADPLGPPLHVGQMRSDLPTHGAGGGRYPGGGRLLSQHGGGAMLLEHDFRHPQPDNGSKVLIAIRAKSKRLVNILKLRQDYARSCGR